MFIYKYVLETYRLLNFSGTLNPNNSLFRLHHLRYLNLSDNDFTSSSLPSGFGKLNRLEVLSLASNGFIGQVPSLFSNLSMLSYLDISQNELTGSFPLLWNLSKLHHLYISYNHLSETLNPSSSLFGLNHLRYLNLDYNNFNSSSIPSEFGHLNRLEVLSLSSNGFMGQVPSSFSNLSRLTDLYLEHNKFTSSFPPVQNLTKLSNLFLSDNHFFGTIPSSLFTMPFLSFLLLTENHLTGPIEIHNSSSSSRLKIMFLGGNNFEGNILEPISKLITLRWLKLSFLNTSHPIDLTIFSSLKSLETLDLSANSISPASLSSYSGIPLTMDTLYLSNCDITEFPNILKPLQSLMLVDLSDNRMKGKPLRTLDVGYNRLTGKLPRSLLNCSSLKFQSVDHNRIEDTFPFWLKALPNLQVLILRSNKFYGPISPPHHGPLAFPELQIFEISDNKFTGILPQSYFENWKASILQMNEDGSIYMGYQEETQHSGAGYYLVGYDDRIDLQYKGLSMVQSKVLTFYSAIDFSANRLEGQIPESIGLLKGLIALNLSNNAFTGHIPLSLGNLTELESLDLSSNQLSGTIPNGLGGLSFLAYVNVSHNQLKGKIPQGTQITGQPKSSFEGNAGLCGLPLQESCFGTNPPPAQQPKEEEGEDEQVLNWKAVAIGYAPGVLLGLAIAQLIASYKPKWLVKIIGPNKCRNR